jgi:uncharacterized protein (TIGR02147 family)
MRRIEGASRTELREAAHAVRPSAFLGYREFLEALYAELARRLGAYSYLAFAEDLGFSRTNVVQLVVKGRRPLSPKAGERIADALGLRGRERRFLATLILHGNAREPERREGLFRELLAIKAHTLPRTLVRDQLAYYAEWFHPVIREMALMPGFRSDPAWIAARVTPRIRPEQARASLELLETLGLLRFDAASGRHVPAETDVTTGDEVASIGVVRFHQTMISLARESITATDERARDVSSITVPATAATFARLKSEVQAFRKRLMALADEAATAGGPQEVYQINFQLFPVTTGAERETRAEEET